MKVNKSEKIIYYVMQWFPKFLVQLPFFQAQTLQLPEHWILEPSPLIFDVVVEF